MQFPTAVALSKVSFMTTLPALMAAFGSMSTSSTRQTLGPMQTLLPMITACP